MLIECIVLILAIFLFRLYQKSTKGICKSTNSLRGKTAIVTGGTSGIGLKIAQDFAKRGAKVIICCPFEDEGKAAKASILKDVRDSIVDFKYLDLSSLQSVRHFAAEILNTEDRLDILVNNAGVGVPGDYETPDGLSFIMQVNYFGHFLLTLLLLPLLKKSAPSRIITTSSSLHFLGHIDPGRVKGLGYSYSFQLYCNSKFYVIPFSRELTKKLKGTGVVVNTVDPGAVSTRIFDSAGTIVGFVIRMYNKFLFKNSWEGAQTAIHVAVDDSTAEVSGQLFKDCQQTRAVSSASDAEMAEFLWKESIKLVKISEDELEKCFS